MCTFVNTGENMKPNYAKYKINNLISINKIVTIHYHEFGKDFHFEGESHDFWEMVYVDKGRVKITTPGRSFYLKQGEVAFHKPNEFHTLSADGIVASNVFVMSFVCSSAAMSFFKNKVTEVPAKLKKFIASIIEENNQTFHLAPVTGTELRLKEDAPIGSPQMIRIHLEEFLIMLVRAEASEKNPTLFLSKESMENHLVSGIISIMEENIESRITMEEICARLNYSRAYLSKMFKNFTGHTMVEYFVKMKIDRAKDMIQEGDYNFAQISDRLAFDNPHYFSRVFKKVTNLTPSEYKKSVLH